MLGQNSQHNTVQIGGIYEQDFVFFSAIFLLKFRKMGPQTKLPKSPRSLPLQPLVDLSALENFQPRPVNTFFCSAQYEIPDLKREYRYFINKHQFKVGSLAHPDLT